MEAIKGNGAWWMPKEATKGACYLERDMGITGNWWTGNTDEDLQTAS